MKSMEEAIANLRYRKHTQVEDIDKEKAKKYFTNVTEIYNSHKWTPDNECQRRGSSEPAAVMFDYSEILTINNRVYRICPKCLISLGNSP
ncbi:MAG: hypothetical protein WA667_21825 [Candidatus Nitrosopolaris sp.]